jgi:hypothetical protein
MSFAEFDDFAGASLAVFVSAAGSELAEVAYR